MTRTRATRLAVRRGLSLLEVILAIAILGVALASVGQLVRLGVRGGERARDMATAQIICETVLGELAAGVTPLQSVEGAPVPNQEGWVYSVSAVATELEGLMSVEVTARREDIDSDFPMQFTVARLMLDPLFEQLLEEEAAAAAAAEEEAAALEAEAL